MNLKSEFYNHWVNKQSFYILSLITFLFALSFILYKNTISLEPSFVHSWAQTDRYALALGFLNNNFDFFHPQTFTLDLQFPATAELKIKEGITRVDFPIHEYIIALIMKMSGSKSPVIFRCYILLYSWVGLIFLALFVQKLSGSRIKGFFVMVFVFTAPVYTYYQAGFLPTIPSMANALIGLYFYLLYKTDKNSKYLYLTILFFTLSSLTRTPFVIIPMAFLGQQVLEWIRNRNVNSKELISFLISFCVIGGYFLYNQYLGNKYGSIFLSHPLPAKNFEETKEMLDYSWTRWHLEYFTKYHYYILLFFLVIMVVSLFRNAFQAKYIFVLILIIFLGESAYVVLMARQFIHHDYYFLDTFYLVIILLIAVSISVVKVSKYFKIGFVLLLMVATIAFINQTNKIQVERYTYHEGDLAEIIRSDYNGAEFFLDSLNVSKNATLLVLNSYSYNIPLVKMNRKGYALVRTNKENIIKSMGEKFDYIVTQDRFLLSDVIAVYPQIVTQIKKVASNGKITLYKKFNNPSKTITEFIGLKPEDMIMEAKFDYDSNYDTVHWSNWQASSNIAYSGKQSGIMLPETEYSLAFSKKLDDFNGNENVFVSVETLMENQSGGDGLLALSLDNESGNILFKSNKLIFYKDKQWIRQLMKVTLPAQIGKGATLKIFLWNSGKDTFYYDDFTVSIYKP